MLTYRIDFLETQQAQPFQSVNDNGWQSQPPWRAPHVSPLAKVSTHPSSTAIVFLSVFLRCILANNHKETYSRIFNGSVVCNHEIRNNINDQPRKNDQLNYNASILWNISKE